jgi:hypothetical protein
LHRQRLKPEPFSLALAIRPTPPSQTKDFSSTRFDCVVKGEAAVGKQANTHAMPPQCLSAYASQYPDSIAERTGQLTALIESLATGKEVSHAKMVRTPNAVADHLIYPYQDNKNPLARSPLLYCHKKSAF